MTMAGHRAAAVWPEWAGGNPRVSTSVGVYTSHVGTGRKLVPCVGSVRGAASVGIRKEALARGPSWGQITVSLVPMEAVSVTMPCHVFSLMVWPLAHPLAQTSSEGYRLILSLVMTHAAVKEDNESQEAFHCVNRQ